MTKLRLNRFKRNGLPIYLQVTHIMLSWAIVFAHKLITQWLDIESGADGLVYCDGSGDGGIDVAYLDRGDVGEIDGNVDTSSTGDTWYIVQSKYGKAFQGTGTLLAESQKVVDTLDGKRPQLSSLAELSHGLCDTS